MTDTTAATIRILSFDRARAGRTLTVASVEVEIAGVVIVLHGLRVVEFERGVIVEAPQYRPPASSAWTRSVELSAELAEAVEELVADAFFGR